MKNYKKLNQKDWEALEGLLGQKKYNKKNGDRWLNIPISFDIRVTNLNDVAFSYLWGVSVNNDWTIYGRYWSEFISFFERFEEILKNLNLKTFIFCDNLNYKFAFLYEFLKEKIIDAFARSECDLFYFKTSFTCWKCSQKLTRLPLVEACVMYGVDFKKYENNKIYYPTSELPPEVLENLKNSLFAVNDLIFKLKENKGVSALTKLPLSFTGFIRSKIKKRCENADYHFKYVGLRIDNEIYSLAEDAQKGGSCEVSFFKKNKIIDNVSYYDFVSQHIYIMLCEYFPMSAFKSFEGNTDDLSKVYDLFQEKCCIFDIIFESIELKKEKDFGIINLSHIKNIYEDGAEIEKSFDFRLIEGKNIHLTLNEIDFVNISSFYNFKVYKIYNLYYCSRSRLPWQIRDSIFELYKEKVDFKQHKGTDLDFLYQNKKQELNAISGMIQTKAIQPEWNLLNSGKFEKKELSNADKFYFLNEYSKSWGHFVYFPWGNWIISHSRKLLYDLIDCANDHIYHDTDSCYSVGFDLNKINKLNKEIEKKTAEYGYNLARLGQAEFQDDNLQFKILGIKNYAVKKSGEITITCAGVPKSAGVQLKNDLNNFKLAFNFKKAQKIGIYRQSPIKILEDPDGVQFETAGFCLLKNQDFIISNFDSKYNLLTGGVYRDEF